MIYKENTKYDNECAICLEKLHNRSCIYMDDCHHIYHYDCIENYIENLNCQVEIFFQAYQKIILLS